MLQRRNCYRNSDHLLRIPGDFIFRDEEYASAKEYILGLQKRRVNYTHPGCDFYPEAFLKMKEPPLFLEYIGDPVWRQYKFLSVVGSRDMECLTEQWMRYHLTEFLRKTECSVGLVSGGAIGVDQAAHRVAIKNRAPTIFVLPSGLQAMYPKNLADYRNIAGAGPICFLSEFESNQPLYKSHFYFRNRLIAALGEMTLVAQATLKSGSLLTVHHCLEIGKPVLTLPAHPEMLGFKGNIKLMQEGAAMINGFSDLLDFWKAESWPN